MTGNDIVEQRRLLRNSRCLSSGCDLLYLQFKPTIWAQRYPRKHTNCTNPFQELQRTSFCIPLRHAENSSCIETVQRYLCRVSYVLHITMPIELPPKI